jgi:hypothetical protein
MYHPQLDPVVEGHLRLPSERAARTVDGAMGWPGHISLRRQVPRDQRSANVFRHEAQEVVNCGRLPTSHVEHRRRGDVGLAGPSQPVARRGAAGLLCGLSVEDTHGTSLR